MKSVQISKDNQVNDLAKAILAANQESSLPAAPASVSRQNFKSFENCL